MTLKTYFALVHPYHADKKAAAPRLYVKLAHAKAALRECDNASAFRIVEVQIPMAV